MKPSRVMSSAESVRTYLMMPLSMSSVEIGNKVMIISLRLLVFEQSVSDGPFVFNSFFFLFFFWGGGGGVMGKQLAYPNQMKEMKEKTLSPIALDVPDLTLQNLYENLAK